jgi:DNA-binding HxlR family transcriptional regulator
LARALELVGERWAMLVVRDLLLSPKRFSDLRRGLPRIPTNILAARLKEFERAGLVRRRLRPESPSAVVYELTAYGHELRPILLSLGAWGARALGEPHPDDVMNADSLALALEATFQKDKARGASVTFEIRVGPAVAHARVENGALHTGPSPLPGADLAIEAGPVLRSLLLGDVTPSAALASGQMKITGDRALLDRFVELFRLPSASWSEDRIA